jgi:hypothetical protein
MDYTLLYPRRQNSSRYNKIIKYKMERIWENKSSPEKSKKTFG